MKKRILLTGAMFICIALSGKAESSLQQSNQTKLSTKGRTYVQHMKSMPVTIEQLRSERKKAKASGKSVVEIDRAILKLNNDQLK